MRPRWRTLAAPAALGLAGTVVVSIAAPRLVDDPVSWWLSPRLGSAARPMFYTGMVGVALAWLWLGYLVKEGRGTRVGSGQLAAIGALWSFPLLAGPPLFSHDLYSYLAQGTIANLGLSPYHDPPTVLAAMGHAGVLHAVSPFWRRTTAPYGPLFLGLVSLVVGITGSNVVLGAIVVRLLTVALGFGLLARYLPRLAERFGASPAGASWLVLLNPLLLFQLVAPGHNDILMAGLMVAGLAVALDGRPLAGIVVCAAAATIKVPALAAVAFLAVVWVRSAQSAERRRVAVEATLAAVATLAVVTLITGLGFGWLSGSVFSTPRKVHLAITPGTALGWTLASGLRSLGAHVGTRGLESACGLVALAGAAVLAVRLLSRADRANLAWRLGLVLLAFALGGPAAWPWYLSWGLVLLAAWPRPPGATIALVATSIIAAFAVKANGILALPLPSAPAVLCVYLGCAGVAWWAWWSRPQPTRASALGDELPAPTGTGELAQIR